MLGSKQFDCQIFSVVDESLQHTMLITGTFDKIQKNFYCIQ